MKIALVGCGAIARSHLRFLRKVMPNAYIYLCDVDRRKAEELVSKLSTQAIYTGLDDLLLSDKPDAVHVLTPPQTHAALAEKAILAGCHVLIEKPVTETTEEFIKISNLARRHDKILSVDYSTLGMPVVLRAKREISSGRFGRLIAVHCSYGCSWPDNAIPYGDANHWSYSLRGGVLQNWADHPASLVLDFMDPFEECKIFFSRRNILPRDCPDLLHVALRNQDQVGSFTLSVGHGNTDIRAQFILEGGFIGIDIRKMLITYTRGRGPQNFIKKAISGILEGYSLVGETIRNSFRVITGRLQREPGIYNLISNFYKTINSQEKLLISHETVLSVTELLDKIWKELDYEKD